MRMTIIVGTLVSATVRSWVWVTVRLKTLEPAPDVQVDPRFSAFVMVCVGVVMTAVSLGYVKPSKFLS